MDMIEETILPVHFDWRIPDRGYHWVKGRPSKEVEAQTDAPERLFLIEHQQSTEYRPYSPLDDEEPSPRPSFLDFAKLSGAGEIVQFANRYGWLGIGESIESATGQVVQGEALARWTKEIYDMRLLLQLNEAICMKDEVRREKRLQTFFTWNADQTGVTMWWRDGQTVRSWQASTALTDRRPKLRPLLKPGQCTGAAFLYLITELNRKLSEMIAPCLLLHHKRNIVGRLRPRHLLGALWFQFYQTFLDTSRLRACRRCGKWIDVSQRSVRKMFCDDCVNKRKVYRLRWTNALEEIKGRMKQKGLLAQERKRLIARCATLQRKLDELDGDKVP